MNIQAVKAVMTPAELGIKMISIAPSNFVFQGVQGVRCNGFKLAETPFTNAHFLGLLKQHPDELKQVIANPEELLVKSMLVAAVSDEAVSSPLVFVNQTEASGIAALLGCRLPTELEWERAAAGLNGRVYPWGYEWDQKKAIFNDKGTRAVGLFPAGKSEDGFCDLAGNVWERTSSLYGEIGLSDPQNPVFPQEGIYVVLRGGSWYNCVPAFLRSADRYGSHPEDRGDFFGFRLAEDLK
jgi:formylglycine-generating enzyme required for sulfatase activity